MAKGLYEKWLEPDNLLLLQGWRRDGLDLTQIAKNIGINRATLYKWCTAHDKISNALKKGTEVCCYETENALYKSALGYDVTETEQTETVYTDGTKVVTKRAKKRHIPPNLGAICFILKNRMPEKWRDRPEVVDTQAIDVLNQILNTTRDQAKAEFGVDENNDIHEETEVVYSESDSPV